jgi:hypothetical protein
MSEAPRFPRLVTQTLNGTSIILPDSLGDRYAFIAIAFRRSTQPVVDSWMEAVVDTLTSPSVTYYEVPILAGGWRTISGFIENGMRSGVAVDHHDHVATYFGSTDRLRRRLGIDDPSAAYVYLVDGSGLVHWSHSGWANDEAVALLADRIRRLPMP